MTKHSSNRTTTALRLQAAIPLLVNLILFFSVSLLSAHDAEAQTPCTFRNINFKCYGAVAMPSINPIPLGSVLTLTVQPGSTYQFHPQTVILAEPITERCISRLSFGDVP